MNSQAKLRAVEKYNAKNYDRLTVRLKKDDMQALRDYVGSGSINGFITQAIQEKIDREKLQPQTEIVREPFED